MRSIDVSKIEIISDGNVFKGKCEYNEDYISDTHSVSFEDSSKSFEPNSVYVLYFMYVGRMSATS